MNVQEIRQKFFDFFESKGHEIVPSAPMVVKNDPTLMFTNAGMNQFKDYFLGHSTPKNLRVANSQKCLRVSGKHNDLEEVGVDTYHHTMFEMLGNWSFGDYFKKEAIAWAWELLTEVYQLPVDRLYVTVFEGDDELGVDLDQASIDEWKNYIAEDRILLANKKDNFWEMGETGPCGPCTEIHVDLRSDEERSKIDGKSLVNEDHPQVIEIWNNVFMQFNRKANGTLEKLPKTHVDTGMGLERLAMALQGKQSNYDSDFFQTMIRKLESIAQVKYGSSESTDIALRVISDHIRAIAFSVTDGQLPSNTGAGYVIRRILRRAVRYGYQTLSLNEPFMCELSKVLVQEMGDAFPELKNQESLIYKVIQEEELSFFRTLEQGLKRMEQVVSQTKKEGKTEIDGAIVFELYDTFGFPADLTSLIARENELSIDQAGFDAALKQQKDRSRAATAVSADDWVELLEDNEEEFIGYDHTEATVKIVKYRKVEQKKKSFYQLVFNLTPFYPEGGGQVGDTGYIADEEGNKTSIIDTKKENNLIIHLVSELPENIGHTFKAIVDTRKRNAAAKNHSATHLLHHALRTILGDHVEQKGSLVNADYLRFDFSHFSKVTEEEIKQIEAHIKSAIKANIELDERRNIPMSVALEEGAMALFGEKYGDTVRMIKFGDSIELCGGIHVNRTSDIGTFKVLSEGAVSAGVRRIEMITGPKAEQYFQERDELVEELKALLKAPKNIVQAVKGLQEKIQNLQSEVDGLKKAQAQQIKQELKDKIKSNNGQHLLFAKVDLDAGSIKDLLFQFKGEYSSFAGVIGGVSDGKCSLSIMISEDIVKASELHAGNLVREAAKHIKGGGGGQPFFATAGGKDPNGLDEAIAVVAAKFEG